MSLQASNFKLLGGALCLDFVNTKNWDPSEQAYDFFRDYPALLQWSLQLGIVTQPEAENLYRLASHSEREAVEASDKVHGLRDAIYRIFSTAARGGKAPLEDLILVNAALSGALSHLQVGYQKSRYVWQWADQDLSLDSPLWKVLQSTGELLTSEKEERVKRCDGCGWLFLDTTRSGRRRWCDMSLCGNRAKARRHYARVKAGG